MKYRSIIVCLDDAPHSADRLQFALGLAARQTARLVGMYRPVAQTTGMGILSSTGTLRRQWARSERSAENRRAFLDGCRRFGVSPAWLDVSRHGLRTALGSARNADLIIVGRTSQGRRRFRLGKDTLEHFLLDVGRPILVTPDDGPLNAALCSVAIAWDGSREAARAVADALPVLEQARRVIVLTAREMATAVGPASHALSIRDYLAQHGIRAELIENDGIRKVGDWLLLRAKEPDINADLLIAGAYGDNRFYERWLGGVTHALLCDGSLPILMSH